jgi:hypothetical protein
MTISKQDVIDSFKAYHADSSLTYNEMTKLEEVLQAILSINFSSGGGGDATAANQDLQLTELEEINANISPTILTYGNQGLSVTANINTGTTILHSLFCTNLNASTRYILFFLSTGSTAGTPLFSFPVYGNSGFLIVGSETFGIAGATCPIGLTWGFSTTPNTYTAGTASDCLLVVRYR